MSDYRTFWKVDGSIFLGPASSDALYVGTTLRPVLERIKLFCQGNYGLLLVAGEPGTGKSTLAKWIFDTLSQDTHEVLLTGLVQRETVPGWLTPRMAELLGVQRTHGFGQDTLRTVAARLDDLVSENRQLVVVIDAAHLATTPESLSEIAALLNLQALTSNCLSFVLFGDQELLDVIDAAVDLKTKVAQVLMLPKLDLDETRSYLEWRCTHAGLKNPFDKDAVQLIHGRAKGVLAHINSYAENCLIVAFELGLPNVNRDVALAAVRHLVPESSGLTPLTSLGTSIVKKAGLSSLVATAARSERTSSQTERPPESNGVKLTSLFKSEPDRGKS